MRIIQTNLLVDPKGFIHDHQALIYEVESWEKLIQGVLTGRIECINPTMTMRKNGINKDLLELKYDAFHMTADYKDGTKSLFYSVEE